MQTHKTPVDTTTIAVGDTIGLYTDPHGRGQLLFATVVSLTSVCGELWPVVEIDGWRETYHPSAVAVHHPRVRRSPRTHDILRHQSEFLRSHCVSHTWSDQRQCWRVVSHYTQRHSDGRETCGAEIVDLQPGYRAIRAHLGY